MSDTSRDDDKSIWAIGGGVLTGIGVGFFFLHQSALLFAGSMVAGPGFGLLATSVLSAMRRGQ